MRQGTLLILNTGVTLFRMLLTVGVSLLVMRWLLGLLGEDGLGLIQVFGATGLLLTLVANALVGSVQRDLAYAMGQGDREGELRTYNTALLLFAGLGVGIGALGWALAAPIVAVFENIPESRETACVIALGASITAMAVNIVMTPLRGYLIAAQSIAVLSVFELGGALLELGAVGLLALAMARAGADAGGPWSDPIVVWSVLLVGVQVVLLVGMGVGVGVWRDAARPRPGLARWAVVPRLLSLGGWDALSTIGWRIRSQGSQVVMLNGFGAATSGAFGIAIRLAGYAQTLGFVMQRVAQPAIAKMHAKGQTDRFHHLVLASSRVVGLMMLGFVVPVAMEIDALLALWLGEGRVPADTASLALAILTWTWIKDLAIGHQFGARAIRDLRADAIIVMATNLGGLLVAIGIVVATESPAWIVPATTCVAMVVMNGLRAVIVGRKLGVGVWRWLTDAVLPVLGAALVVTASAGAVVAFVEPGPVRLVLVCVASWASLGACAWTFGLHPEEKGHFRRLGGRVTDRLRGRSGPAGAGEPGRGGGDGQA